VTRTDPDRASVRPVLHRAVACAGVVDDADIRGSVRTVSGMLHG